LDAAAPIFFAPNRVWRLYTGGALLGGFAGDGDEADGSFPEDWLASTVRAFNGEHAQGPDEGLARVRTADGEPGATLAELLERHADELLGAEYVARFGAELAPLCKYLDSAVRLPVQCHPDRAIARRLYGSDHGKTECWHILQTREVAGERPYLLMGFRPGATREAFARAVAGQDADAMVAMLHKITPEPGQTYFVPPRLPHAIGPGVLMLEVQEPSDWVVQPEPCCAGNRLSETDMWGPLSADDGLEVFDYAPMSKERLPARVRAEPRPPDCRPGGEVCAIIDDRHTDAFAVARATIHATMRLSLPRPFGIVVVTGGAGRMTWPGGGRTIRRGEYFLQPAGLESIEYAAAEPLSLVLCLPPRPERAAHP